MASPLNQRNCCYHVHTTPDASPVANPVTCTQACIFLQPDNKCGIHTVRPGQCSTYPWWPELMERKGWEWEKGGLFSMSV